MKDVIQSYLAEKVVQDLRRGVPLGDDLCAALNEFPLIDHIRNAVELRDVDSLIGTAADGASKLSALSISLLRRHENDERVKAYLRRAWEYNATSYSPRLVLMWRLLDDPALDPSIREEVFSFVMSNIDRVLSDVPSWFGGQEKLLDGCRSRLGDPSFPRSKAWIYLACVAASDDKDAAVALLRPYVDSDERFTSTVARKMLQRLEE